MDVRTLASPKRPLLITPRSNRIIVAHDDGGVAGEQVEHWDGRVDATIFARPVRVELPRDLREPVLRALGVIR